MYMHVHVRKNLSTYIHACTLYMYMHKCVYLSVELCVCLYAFVCVCVLLFTGQSWRCPEDIYGRYLRSEAAVTRLSPSTLDQVCPLPLCSLPGECVSECVCVCEWVSVCVCVGDMCVFGAINSSSFPHPYTLPPSHTLTPSPGAHNSQVGRNLSKISQPAGHPVSERGTEEVARVQGSHQRSEVTW